MWAETPVACEGLPLRLYGCMRDILPQACASSAEPSSATISWEVAKESLEQAAALRKLQTQEYSWQVKWYRQLVGESLTDGG